MKNLFLAFLGAFVLCSAAMAQSLPPLPPDEQGFVNAVVGAIQAYDAASSDMQRRVAKEDRRIGAQNALNNRREVQNWYGTIKEVGTSALGRGMLRVLIHPLVEVSTWPNEISDRNYGTLLEPSSPVYRELANANAGDVVMFSGFFHPSDKDFCHEKSLTTSGSITKPSYTFTFTQVQIVK